MGQQEFIYEERYVPDPRVSRTYKPIKYIIEKECWICVSHAGSKSRGNYPTVNRNARQYRMSRYVYEQEYGSIPEGMYIMHLCDNPRCINPKHLQAGTPQDNTDDMVRKNRKPLGSLVPCAKLTDGAVRKILRDDRPKAVIARQYGVSKRAIQFIKNRRTWKHIS